MSDMRNTLDGINNRLDTAGGKTSKLEGTESATIQNEKQKEKRMKKK